MGPVRGDRDRGAREPEPLFGLKESFSDRVDKVLLHPISGLLAFALIMGGLFWTIFSLAKFPMDWIIEGFDLLSSFITAHLPEGILTDLLSNGVVAGVGSTLVFLPQICLLFFLISLLEDTGYLARASFLMDRLLRPFGLPGNAFVPLLSSHACALPGILATRGIPDLKQRLTTILVAPFMTCSARLPVYVLLTSLLFADRPAMAALAFVGCYALGMIAGVLSALVARRTILRGPARPMAMELPSYKRPSVRTAAMTTIDRAWVFLKNAGTVILAISVLMWWLGEYPKAEPPKQAVELRERAAALDPEGTVDHVMLVDPASGRRVEVSPPAMRAEADHLESINQKTHSFMGRIGRTVQPVFSPMDWDWRVCIGVMASFAAREVFVATMSVVVAGEDNDDVGDRSLIDSMRTATRDDGRTPIFTPKVCWSLLVFYVLAMQCLATLALTARETGAGGWKWALLQFGWMSALAYLAAFITATVVG